LTGQIRRWGAALDDYSAESGWLFRSKAATCSECGADAGSGLQYQRNLVEKANAEKIGLILTTAGNFLKSVYLMTPVVFAEARAL
jgi:hypothetical protein